MTRIVTGRTAGPPDKTASSTATVMPVTAIARNCRQCGQCVAECAFLQQNATPGELAQRYTREPAALRQLAYSCSLCSLCTSICPLALEPATMFRGWRQEAVRLGEAPLKSHRRLLLYEQLGGNPFFRLLHLPPGCTSVFFPGCALPGIRPEQTLELYLRLQAIEPTMGIMLDCCNQPSHDLGRTAFFQERFRKRLAQLAARNIRTVLTACPSCHRALTALPNNCTVTSAYTMLASHGIEEAAAGVDSVPFAIHDSCSTRFMTEMQSDIRTLCSHRGLKIVEMAHNRTRTFCCGEGGAAGHTDNTAGSEWSRKRWLEAGDTPLITYCAGCTTRLGQQARVHHLVDLLFTDTLPKSSVQPQVSSFRRWLNRLSLKLRLVLKGP